MSSRADEEHDKRRHREMSRDRVDARTSTGCTETKADGESVVGIAGATEQRQPCEIPE